MEQGQSKTKNPVFYVKNIGEVNVVVGNGSSIDFGQLGLGFWDGSGWEETLRLDIGEKCKVKGSLLIDSAAAVSDKSFEIVITATE
jgi:hypothetical protein